MRIVHPTMLGTLAAILVVLSQHETAAFTTRTPPLRPMRLAPVSGKTSAQPKLQQRPPMTALSIAIRSVASKTSLAGKIWPVIRKLYVTPVKAKLILSNVLDITQWFDVVLIGIVAFGLNPVLRMAYERLPEKDKKVPYEYHKRYGVANLVTQAAKVSLSVYAMDVTCVSLSTLGFAFPGKWELADVYAKFAYTSWVLWKFSEFKTKALCKFFKVNPDDMGRVDILNRILNGILVTIMSLVLFDWLSIRMNMAFRGLLGFGSVGTLAFTLASQGLLTQLVSGIFLVFSDKMYVGDNVTFGDGTAGRVAKLGWMETVLRNSDNTLTRVPNALLASQKISNVSRVAQCQVKQMLRFHYEDADVLPELLDAIRDEIKKSCSRLVTDGKQPFRVYWVNYNEDHLEVMVDTHHNIAPIGNAYWENRQNVLLAIHRAVKKFDVEFAQLYSLATSAGEPEWRVVPKKKLLAPKN